jgi:hypothetical protein
MVLVVAAVIVSLMPTPQYVVVPLAWLLGGVVEHDEHYRSRSGRELPGQAQINDTLGWDYVTHKLHVRC